MNSKTTNLFLFLIFTCLYSCQNAPQEPENSIVRIHLKGNVNDLNIYTSPNAYVAEVVVPNVHASLLLPNPTTLELQPYLAIERPQIDK